MAGPASSENYRRYQYPHPRGDTRRIALSALLNTTNMALNRPAAEAGFADAILAFEGQWLGGEIFASFDKQAVALLTRQGQAAMLLS